MAPISSFESILFDGPAPDEPTSREPPAYFADLRLDDVVGSITAGREAHDLAPFFQARLTDRSAIAYRHEVFRDLETTPCLEAVQAFATGMADVREHLAHAGRAHYPYEADHWFLEAADGYVATARRLSVDLEQTAPRSRGLAALTGYLAVYVGSEAFDRLATEVASVKAELATIRYRLRISGRRVHVSRVAEQEPDYGAEVLSTFEKFKQGAGTDYAFKSPEWPDLNHVEAAILDLVARLFPDAFARLSGFHRRHRDLVDPTVARFDREVQFYVAYLEHIGRLRRAGLPFCYPDLTDRSKAIHGHEVFDLALAAKLTADHSRTVTNDFSLRGPERILVVSGPNSGGKTTFARTIGQLHHLAEIGAPVPGRAARLFLVDQIHTHFEREESVEELSGKLEDDLRRIRRILELATPDSLLVMNESFASTTVRDQLSIGRQVLASIIARGMLCVVVTFLDELSALGPSTVSLVAAVDPEEPARRTFRIERRPADGLAYAMAIAEKHHLTYPSVKARVAP